MDRPRMEFSVRGLFLLFSELFGDWLCVIVCFGKLFVLCDFVSCLFLVCFVFVLENFYFLMIFIVGKFG